VSILVMRGLRNQNTVITCGYSIINRSATADVGHRAVGTCQVAHGDADRVIAELVAALAGSAATKASAEPLVAHAGSRS
jgi:hypothetical protein